MKKGSQTNMDVNSAERNRELFRRHGTVNNAGSLSSRVHNQPSVRGAYYAARGSLQFQSQAPVFQNSYCQPFRPAEISQATEPSASFGNFRRSPVASTSSIATSDSRPSVASDTLAQQTFLSKLQETYNKDAEVYQQKQKEKEAKKRQEWLRRHERISVGNTLGATERRDDTETKVAAASGEDKSAETKAARMRYIQKLQQNYDEDVQKFKEKPSHNGKAGEDT